MSDYATVEQICRQRPRSKNARIIGGLIVGCEVPAGKPAAHATSGANSSPKVKPQEKERAATAPAADRDHDGEAVLVKIKVDRKTHSLLREIAKANDTGVQGVILRSIKRTIYDYKVANGVPARSPPIIVLPSQRSDR
jgi:hypothetical protein